MLVELKRPDVEVFNRDAEDIKQKILAKYQDAEDLVEEATIDDEAFKDLVTLVNYCVDPWDNQVFYSVSARKILIYDIINQEFIFEPKDLIAIIEA